MRTGISISLRLTLWFSAVFLCGFVIFGSVMWLDLGYSLSQGRDKTLAGRARRLEDLLENFGADPPSRRAAKFKDFVDATPEGNLIQVSDLRGIAIYPPARTAAVRFPWPEQAMASKLDSSQPFVDLSFSGKRYRVLCRTVAPPGGPYRIFVAGQLEDNRLLLRRFSRGLLWTTPALLALSALSGYFLSRRALGPVDRLTASARSIAIGNLSARLPISNTGDELQRLAETCNEMLHRVETAVTQITRFTADASHELRTPISFIRTAAEYALRNPAMDAESCESFREILHEAEEASRLLEDMLILARSDAGHAQTLFEPVDLAAILADACERIRPAAEARAHVLSVNSSDRGPVRIAGDASSLRRLFWILLDNAIKYTPAGGRINVMLDAHDAEARVSVQDNGVGIPPAALPHIFERFYRVDSSRGEEAGTGLGLAIAKWIADIHHAALTVQSAENLGATFQVAFRMVG